MSLPVGAPAGDALGILSRFRVEFYECPYARRDALFELTDAVLCADGPVQTLVELSLVVEHQRGHGVLYAALDRGWLEPTRLRRMLAGLPLPKAADGGSNRDVVERWTHAGHWWPGDLEMGPRPDRCPHPPDHPHLRVTQAPPPW
ncbi:hypothetical protein M2283_009809 [Streptomyces pseudovenezuelae]|uniref:Transposase IS701-like DDE domain-containing protein n=1 Tax=Streptomyces pseudovenezuelae TaxID=67350 RepID=A0ABT6M1M8_9ACTN|nr:hypothetical protein [Streptomyces pseudovenezuelae]